MTRAVGDGTSNFSETGSTEKWHFTGRPRRYDGVDRVKQSFTLSPEKSISRASAEL